MEILETLLNAFVNLAMLLFEYIGVAVITYAGIQGMVNYVRKDPATRLKLAQGLAMGLEFKLGSEILRTVIVRSLDEIYIVAGIIVLRAVLTLLIHWEIKNELAEEKERAELNVQESHAESIPQSESVQTEQESPSQNDSAHVQSTEDDSVQSTAEVSVSTDSENTAQDNPSPEDSENDPGNTSAAV